MPAVFTYGTLMWPEVMEAVTGNRFRRKAATVTGCERYRFKRRVYPGLIRKAGHGVNGIVYFDVDGMSMKLLDEFEDDFYQRETVIADTPEDSIQCQAYWVSENHQYLLSRDIWDPARFEKHDLEKYLEMCRC